MVGDVTGFILGDRLFGFIGNKKLKVYNNLRDYPSLNGTCANV
jgi:hypothetical protein